MSAPRLTVDPDSQRPPFEQVRAQLADAIASGAIGAEERLPPIRQLATELGLAVNTVARAYRELESAGVVETRGRNGTFVVGTPNQARQQGQTLTRAHIDRMRELGINPTETLAMLRREIETAEPDA
jgi:DNA-binding transcriptional regulator YhcF (GntR family)